MKKRLTLALIFSMFLYTREAYAIFDIMAKVQSALELYKDIQKKITEVQKLKRDMEKRIREGFALGSNCFANPLKCNVDAIKTLGEDAANAIKNIRKDPPIINPAPAILKKDMQQAEMEKVDAAIEGSYIYKRNQQKSIEETSKNRKKINAVVADEVATLFAKAVAVRSKIYLDEGDLYKYNLTEEKDEVLSAHALVNITTQLRLDHILELRSYMVGARATSELTEQSIEEKD